MKPLLLRAEDLEHIGWRWSYDTWAKLGLEELRLRGMEHVGLVAPLSPEYLVAARLRDYDKRHYVRLQMLKHDVPEMYAEHMGAVRAAAEAALVLPPPPKRR